MSTLPFPIAPEVPESQRSSGTCGLRYEDVTQDGFLKVGSMLHVLGSLFFRDFWSKHRVGQVFRGSGVVPILSRLTMESLQGPLSVRKPLEAEGAISLGTQRDAAGEVARLMLNMDARMTAPLGRTHPPRPPNAGEPIPVGRIHAEHVFTRPFGPPAERKVTRLEHEGESLVPDAPVVSASPADVLSPPAQAEQLEARFALDPVPHTFGLIHTDSNQHVNSLVYPQLFEEALVRRVAALGASTAGTLVQHMDLAFRKPSFAGERVQIWLRTFVLGGRRGAVGYLAPEGVPPERAHVTCRMWTRAL